MRSRALLLAFLIASTATVRAVTPDMPVDGSVTQAQKNTFLQALGLDPTVATLEVDPPNRPGPVSITPNSARRYRFAPWEGTEPYIRKLTLNAPSNSQPAEFWLRLEMPESGYPTVEIYSLSTSSDPLAIFQSSDLPGGVAWACFWFDGAEWHLLAAGWNL